MLIQFCRADEAVRGHFFGTWRWSDDAHAGRSFKIGALVLALGREHS